MVGIVGYGAYIPRNRIKLEEIAKVWGADAPSYKRGLLLYEKSVPSPDQDTITMSVEATKSALKRANIPPMEIGAVYVGSESHPYAVKPSGTVLAEAIGATPEVHCADYEFACKAGSEAMYVCIGLVESGSLKYGLAVGADTSQGAPGDALEYSAAAGAAAFIFGKDNLIAKVHETYSYMTDTPDFWRREYQFYPRHAGRFTGEPAYFKHI
ncbi:MAG: hydroxymethylglutaryl-CoA synthase, partial [candidate division Zixibacteria bacterium]|nr:hydroxymethylglutaryl-CoA synthase [candidate division Zixibacteria bacterium]